MTDWGPSERIRFAEPFWLRDGGDVARHLYQPIVLRKPDRLVSPPSWLEHIPFAFWIVDALRPTCFVELGTQSGNSYAAFAQAVDTLGLPTACYSVDTWKGDPHTGAYDENIFNDWREYHERRFSGFSRLIRARFSEAVKQFADDSIDLIHLDGYHTLEAVREDLATWLPKMSSRGVVLVHDINVREPNFGAWQFWQEVERMYPSFAFLHGHGLGVLGVGRKFPERVEWLLTRGAHPAESGEIRQFFSQLGRRISLEYQCEELDRTVRSLQARQSGQAGLDGELSLADLERGRVSTERELRVLESRLATECERRDRTIRELDADARALAVQLQRARDRRPARLSRLGQSAVNLARRMKISRRSRVSRALTVLRTGPGILAAACRARDLRTSVRALGRLFTNPRKITEACIVARSGVFDEAYYLSHNPDVSSVWMRPLVHYILRGASEGRRPNPLFDPKFYLEQYPDVARARLEPLSHFLVHGTSEERNPSPYFDTKYYLSTNQDVRDSGINPLVHFLQTGWRESRNPLPSFDCAGYIARYEDVRSSGMNPLVHYVEIGRSEGRTVPAAGDAALPPPRRVQLTTELLRPPRTVQPVILCLTHVCPYPTYAGNAYRINRMLKWLQTSGFRIVPIVVPLGGEMPDKESIRRVEEQFSNVVVVDRAGAIQYALKDVPDVLASLNLEYTPRYSALLGEDASVSGRARELQIIDRTYCHDAAIAVLLRLHSALKDHVLLAEYVWMTRVFPLLDDRAIKVIDTIDVFSSKKDKVLRHGIRDFWLEPQEEARRLALADLVIAIQREERDALQQLVPTREVVTAGIDFSLVGNPRLPERPRVLYVGSGNPMNVRGLRDFLRLAWPAVQKQVTDAELLVAGAVSDAIDTVPPGVTILGQVDSLDELYKSVRAVINPAFAGTGVKIKTVEALSHLRPMVTWPTGVEGLPDDVISLCDVVHDWFEFGNRVAAKLAASEQEAFSSDDRRLIERSTSPQHVYADLVAKLRQLWDERVGNVVTTVN
jgi:hypothetical protein